MCCGVVGYAAVGEDVVEASVGLGAVAGVEAHRGVAVGQQGYDVVGTLHHGCRVVTRHYGRYALAAYEVADELEYVDACCGIEEVCGLVEQHDGGLLSQCSRHEGSLAFAIAYVGQGARGFVDYAGIDHGAPHYVAVAVGEPSQKAGVGVTPHGDESGHGERTGDSAVAPCQAYAASPLGHAHGRDITAGDEYAAAKRSAQAGHGLQQGGFAGAVGSDHGVERARGYVQPEGREKQLFAVAYAQVLQREGAGGFHGGSVEIVEAVAAHHDVDHHGHADKGCYGVYGQHAAVAGQGGQPKGEQTGHGSGKRRCGHEAAVGGRAHHQTRHMGHGKTQKAYGPAEGRGDGHEQPGHEQYDGAAAGDVGARGCGIALAHEQCVEGLDHEHGQAKERRDGERKGQDVIGAYARKIAQTPYHVAVDALAGGIEVEQRDKRRGEVAQHDAHNEEHDRRAHHGREAQQEGYDGQGADSGADNGCDARPKPCGSCQHDYGHAEACPGGHTQYRGAGQGVVEGGLEHKPGHGEGCSGQGGRYGRGHAQVGHYVSPRGFRGFAAGEHRPCLGKGYFDRARKEAQPQQDYEGRGK